MHSSYHMALTFNLRSRGTEFDTRHCPHFFEKFNRFFFLLFMVTIVQTILCQQVHVLSGDCFLGMKSASQWIKTVSACLIFVSPRYYHYVGHGKKRKQHDNSIQNHCSHPGMEPPDFKLKLVFMIIVSILHDVCLSCLKFSASYCLLVTTMYT